MSSQSSRIPNFFKMSPAERILALEEEGWLSEEDARWLQSGSQVTSADAADKMIENVLGVFGLPMGVALNFLINGKDYVLPMVVEEPSIVAGVSGTAKLARPGGGFFFESPQPLITGQIQLVDIDSPETAEEQIRLKQEELIAAGNASQPNMTARGGGVVGIETHTHVGPESGESMIVIHLLIDSKDAMGANLVNSICEHVAPIAEEITGGRAVLRILSNLTDRCIVNAHVRFSTQVLEGRGMTGEEVRDGIVTANDLALVDPYRATTHNKGIMNGVDAIVVATGNDWRAIESAAHAYAARTGQYKALTQWSVAGNGDLLGEINIPVKVGTVGGSLQSNPAVGLAHRLLGNPNARELAGIIGVVGLAQNFAALRSLATNGIQRNHMRLHARSVASSAKVPKEVFESVVEKLIESGEIKQWKAEEILQELESKPNSHQKIESAASQQAAGKVILMGEHAVVYGQPAIAAAVPLAMSATVTPEKSTSRIRVSQWQFEEDLSNARSPFAKALNGILDRFQLHTPIHIEVDAGVPAGMGLGGSAALAVSVLRAIGHMFNMQWSNDQINELAFELETAVHGTPSGVDNTVATYAETISFCRSGNTTEILAVQIKSPLPLVVGFSGSQGSTAETVLRVRSLIDQQPGLYEKTIRDIGELTQQALTAISGGDLITLGHLMNACQGQLNALQVSTPELEKMIHSARSAGALGAKLTGGGGGGAIIALAEDQQRVVDTLTSAGFRAMPLTVS